MTPIFRSLVLGFVGLLAAANAQTPTENQTTPAPAGTAAATPAAEQTPKPVNPAIEFLEKVEEKNRDLETLHGTFKQVRENLMFSEEVHSTGEFWYTKPNHFRCDYHDPSPAQFFLIKDMGYFYSPENKQLDTFALESGAEAPINEMLVGFGLDVDKILEVFNVQFAPEQPGENLLKIDFISRDTNRTLDFQQISVTFDRKTYEPRSLWMQEPQDAVQIDLVKVEKNAEISPDIYKTEFPEDVTIQRR